MTNADISEIALLAMGAAGLAAMFAREYHSVVAVSHNSALADSPLKTVRRAIVLAVRIWITQRFAAVDRATLDDYRRFRRVIDLLVLLAAINVFMIAVVGIGLVMVFKQTDFESQIRTTDLSLILGYGTTFLVGYHVIDRIYDAIIDRQSIPASIGRVRKRPSKNKAERALRMQESVVTKPLPKQPTVEETPTVSEPVIVYPALNHAERAALKDDPGAITRDLIAAGILDENGQIKDIYKRA